VPGLAAVQLGAELVAAALPALGHLLDGVADGLEPVQLPRPRPLGGPARALPGPQALDLLVEVAPQPPQLEQGLGEHPLGRGQLPPPRRPLGRQRLDQRPPGGQLLAPQRLLVVPRAPLALRRHHRLLGSIHAQSDSLASRRRFEYPVSC
jgi:hypothetical protein